jgi:CubicO group peptidase (beta-lactamase class C family)
MIARLDSLAGAPVHEGRAVGIAVAVVKGADTLLMRGYGKANIELNVKTPDRGGVYEIGSVTKQFTAAAILQLRDARKLSLDDDITKYVPKLNTRGAKIPLRRLLDHTSGIRGITEIAEFGTLFNTGYPLDSAVAMIGRAPADFPVGEAMIYNNSAFILLGLVVEKASGVSYERYVENQIFAPLGMKDSRYCNNAENIPLRIEGYQYEGQTPRVADPNDHSWPYSAGSLCSTTGDLITWIRALHSGKVLTPASYREMTSRSHLIDGTEIRYGMGLSVTNDMRGARIIGHGGAIDGFVAETRWYPDSDLSIVVLINSAGPVSATALASELGGVVVPPVRPVLRPFAGDVTPLAGKYSGPSRGRIMTVDVTAIPQGVAVSINGGPARPLPWLENLSFRLDGALVTFDRQGATSGPATLLRWDAGGGYYMLKRQ